MSVRAPLIITFRDIVGKLDVLRVTCDAVAPANTALIA